ncbi:hypothetical protein SAMN05216326_10126 [Nitrosomonas marina]|uniref:Uncharacterized protein n=1 Tax=Nitrosomonas marina TaxID=917 RepID=A0A1H9Y3H1_9PROT|nr:hypothetical protein SAMN05216325_10721 [Nitrosomonas marina]SES62890.1 hypothetical protein SAMN05216326_10126 [Nitrosomonas marina]
MVYFKNINEFYIVGDFRWRWQMKSHSFENLVIDVEFGSSAESIRIAENRHGKLNRACCFKNRSRWVDQLI